MGGIEKGRIQVDYIIDQRGKHSLLHGVGDEKVDILSFIEQHHGTEVTHTFV